MQSNELIEFFHSKRPKIFWKMSFKTRDSLKRMNDSMGNYLIHIGDDEQARPYTLLGHSIQIVDDDRLTLVYLFPDGTVKEFDYPHVAEGK